MIGMGGKEKKIAKDKTQVSSPQLRNGAMMVVINMEKLLKQKKIMLFGPNDFLNYLLQWTKTLNIKLLCPQGWKKISW